MSGSESAGTAKAEIRSPSVVDGAGMWRVARDSQKLDLNTSYMYLLWGRDFAETSSVATVDGEIVGFVAGFLRPSAPDTLLIWQVAVDASARGMGLAGKMLDYVLDRCSPDVRYLETTVTPDNGASQALFSSLAGRWSAKMDTTRVFEKAQFPDDHEPEDLYRIGPLDSAARPHSAGQPVRQKPRTGHPEPSPLHNSDEEGIAQ